MPIVVKPGIVGVQTTRIPWFFGQMYYQYYILSRVDGLCLLLRLICFERPRLGLVQSWEVVRDQLSGRSNFRAEGWKRSPVVHSVVSLWRCHPNRRSHVGAFYVERDNSMKSDQVASCNWPLYLIYNVVFDKVEINTRALIIQCRLSWSLQPALSLRSVDAKCGLLN